MKSTLTSRWSETTIATGIPPLAMPTTRSKLLPSALTFSARASARFPYSDQLMYLKLGIGDGLLGIVDNSSKEVCFMDVKTAFQDGRGVFRVGNRIQVLN